MEVRIILKTDNPEADRKELTVFRYSICLNVNISIQMSLVIHKNAFTYFADICFNSVAIFKMALAVALDTSNVFPIYL